MREQRPHSDTGAKEHLGPLVVQAARHSVANNQHSRRVEHTQTIQHSGEKMKRRLAHKSIRMRERGREHARQQGNVIIRVGIHRNHTTSFHSSMHRCHCSLQHRQRARQGAPTFHRARRRVALNAALQQSTHSVDVTTRQLNQCITQRTAHTRIRMTQPTRIRSVHQRHCARIGRGKKRRLAKQMRNGTQRGASHSVIRGIVVECGGEE